MIIETERLYLRAYSPEDFEAAFAVFSDPETMQHYPAPFDAERVRGWIKWNQENYRRYGFGLWAVVLKETGAFIGDCGITMQQIDGETLPEIGYHIAKQHWRRGYAKEAAAAVRDWFFRHTEYDAVCACMKHTNTASYRTALAIGMKKQKAFPDPNNGISVLCMIDRKTAQALFEPGTDNT